MCFVKSWGNSDSLDLIMLSFLKDFSKIITLNYYVEALLYN